MYSDHKKSMLRCYWRCPVWCPVRSRNVYAALFPLRSQTKQTTLAIIDVRRGLLNIFKINFPFGQKNSILIWSTNRNKPLAIFGFP